MFRVGHVTDAFVPHDVLWIAFFAQLGFVLRWGLSVLLGALHSAAQ